MTIFCNFEYLSYCDDDCVCCSFYIPFFKFNEWVIMVINLEAKMVDLLSSYHSMQWIHFVNEASKVVGFMLQLFKNPFKWNFVNTKNLHPQYADIVGNPKLSITFVFLIHVFIFNPNWVIR